MKQMLKNKPKLDKFRPNVSEIISHSKKKHLFKNMMAEETQGDKHKAHNHERPSVLPGDLKGARKGITRGKKHQKYNTSKWLQDVNEKDTLEFREKEQALGKHKHEEKEDLNEINKKHRGLGLH